MANDNWRTPPEVFAYYDARFQFVCDVAATSANTLCKRYFTQRDNALTTPWTIHANEFQWVWCNPPYSDPLPWVKRALQQSRQYGIGTCMLLNCDFSTEWGGLLCSYACHIEILTAAGSKEDGSYTSGRIAFIDQYNKPVRGNTKGQFVAVIPPYVEHGATTIYSTSLADVVQNGARCLERFKPV